MPSSCQITSFASFLIFRYISLFFVIFPYFSFHSLFFAFSLNCYEICSNDRNNNNNNNNSKWLMLCTYLIHNTDNIDFKSVPPMLLSPQEWLRDATNHASYSSTSSSLPSFFSSNPRLFSSRVVLNWWEGTPLGLHCLLLHIRSERLLIQTLSKCEVNWMAA